MVQDEPDGATSTCVDGQQQDLDTEAINVLQPSCIPSKQNEVEPEIEDNQSKIKKDDKTSEVRTQDNNEEKEVGKNNSERNSTQAPIAPPRRKKKNKKQTEKSLVILLLFSHQIYSMSASQCSKLVAV